MLAGIGTMNYIGATAKPRPQSPPTSTVETGRVSQIVAGVIDYLPERSWSILTPSTVGTRAMFTRPGLPVGAKVQPGTVLATVNERPIIAVRGGMPFYRTLQRGDAGRDVTQLQKFLATRGIDLGGDRSGVFDSGTARAVHAFYSRLGYVPFNGAGEPVTQAAAAQSAVPLGEMMAISTQSAIAETACGAEGQAADQAPICTVVSQSAAIRVSVQAGDSTQLKPGMPIRTVLNGVAIDAQLGSRVDTKSAESGANAGQDASEESQPGTDAGAAKPGSPDQPSTVSFELSLPKKHRTASIAGAQVSIIVRESPPSALKVVSIAIRSSEDGTTQWLLDISGNTHAVKMGVCAAGYCEVQGDITAGMKIELPGLSPDAGSTHE
ncbi:MAG: hypothetical protein J0H64_05190 [Actinobacteria bacterium]|nr:hypothetical protein [Actinomycetota bacterium]